MRLLPMLFLLVACGSTIERRWSAQDFDAGALEDGRLLVAAVVAVEDLHRDGHGSERAYTERLHRGIAERRDDLQLVPHTVFVDRLDIDRIDALLARYRTRGTFGPDSVSDLQKLQDDARYLVFCRLEENRVHHEGADHAAPDMDESRVDYTASFESRRTLVASFDIFDARDGRLVWTAMFTKEGERRRSRNYGSRDMEGDRELEPNFTWAGEGGFPDAPEFLDLLNSMFQDFAKELPR